VKSGDRVVLANLCAEPHLLPNLIMDHAHNLNDITFFHLRPFGKFIHRYLEPGMEARVKCATAFTGGVQPINQLIREQRADFYPIPLSQLPWLFRSGAYEPDVFVATVSPPDSQGYCSLGVSVDYARAALETAQTFVAEVNENMPRTRGDSLVNIDEIDWIVESKEPIYELPSAEVTSLERKLAANVASVVEDEATIQIGFGGVSESITPFLKEKKNLGMHSEMFPESATTLIEEGALTCQSMSINRGKIICSFSAGTRRLYEWLNDNPMIEMKPLDYTNDSRVISMNHKMTSINTALQVDLYGNIYSDMLGFDQYSGAGGQPDFVLGSTMSQGGRSIIVLPSTTSDGKISRIVASPNLEENPRAPAMPTVSRFHSDYVVTEYGVASLRGKTTHERAEAIIGLAHPNFVDRLVQEGKTLKLLK
jgi:4-hydroxybutyrate CoA-transferase